MATDERRSDRGEWWLGLRASDAAILGDSVARIVTCQEDLRADASPGAPATYALETLGGTRERLDSDKLERCMAAVQERQPSWLEPSGSEAPLLVPYRPVPLVEALARRLGAPVLANSSELYALANDNVSTLPALASEGIIGYRLFVRRASELSLRSLARELGLPFVVKAPLSVSGSGCFLVRSAGDLASTQRRLGRSQALVCEHLRGDSYNAHGIVNASGTTTAVAPSRQLIGEPALTGNPFGWGGSVFGDVPEAIGLRIADTVRAVGRWLHPRGYRGLFGIDAVVADDGGCHVVDLNPRFQSSSLTLSELLPGGRWLGEAHRAAFSGADHSASGTEPGSAPVTYADRSVVHVMVRNLNPAAVRVREAVPHGIYRVGDGGLELVHREPTALELGLDELLLVDAPAPGRVIVSGAALCRASFRYDPATATPSRPWGPGFTDLVARVSDALGVEAASAEGGQEAS